MNVTATLRSTIELNGARERPAPVELPWAKDADETDVLLSVAQLLKHARDNRHTETLAITITF